MADESVTPQDPPGAPTARGRGVAGYRAIVFLDVVGSCALKSELGEQRYFDELESPYLEIVRRILTAIPCREHNDTGDGKLLTFERVEDAVSAALLVQAELRAATWRGEAPCVRIGIHGGETRMLADGEIRGHNVDLCARLTALCLPGQILLTRHVYDDARRFVARHPALEPSPANRPPLVWRNHGAYPFRGFTQRFEVCEVGAEGIAPCEAPTLPAAASTTDRAFRFTENVLRLVRHNPLRSLAAAVVLVAAISLAVNYVWSATQRLPAGSTLPGQAMESGELHALELFRENDDEVWFMQLVGRYEHDGQVMTESKPPTAKETHVAVFFSEPLPYSQRSLEFSSESYRGFDIHVTALLLRQDGWVKVLRQPRDFSHAEGIVTFHVADVARGSQLRIVLFASTKFVTLPKPSGLQFTVR